MNTYFENNQFVKYLYKETNTEDTQEFYTQLLIDNNKYDEMAEYEGIISVMDKIEMNPSKKAVNTILDFAKSINLQAS